MGNMYLLLFPGVISFLKLQVARADHASVIMGNALWVTGGKGENGPLRSTEFVFSNGTVKQGPNLPNWMIGHCMVKLLDGTVLLMGGKTKEGSRGDDKGWQYYPKEKTYLYKKLAKRNRGRYYHACAMFHSPKLEDRPILMLAGGLHAGRSVEVLDYTKRRDGAKWEESK